MTTGFGSRLQCHACDTTLGVVCQPVVAQFHIVPYIPQLREGMKVSLATGQMLCRRRYCSPPSAHTLKYILLFVMLSIHFDPGEDQWTTEAFVFHALLSWPGALYS